MGIEKMSFVSCISDKAHMDDMLQKALTSQLISAENATYLLSQHFEGTPIQEENYYEEDINVLQGYAQLLALSLNHEIKPNKEYTKQEIDDLMAHYEKAFACCQENKSNTNLSEDDEQALDLIRPLGYEALNHLQYINVRFGRLPIQSLKKLTILEPEDYIYEVVKSNEVYAWVIFACADDSLSAMVETLNSFYFETIEIPQVDRKAIALAYKDQLNDLYAYCLQGSARMKLHSYILKNDEHYAMAGYVANKDLEQFKALMQDCTVSIEVKDNVQDTIKAPTLLKNNWFVKPFELFVKMYSLPDYTEIDPTPFLAITYCLLFGIMFGDLGQGALLFIGGLLIEKKTGNQLAGIIGRCGIVAMVFGFLFGSVFGNEHLLIPVHQMIFGRDHFFEVMDSANTMTLLISAVAIGMVLTLSCQIMNVYVKFKQGHKAEALYSHNGIAGIVFFTYVILLLCNMMMGLQLPIVFTMPAKVVFIGVPLILFFLKERFEAKEHGEAFKPKVGWGGYTLEAFFELFDIVLSFVTNSMSYLRVGGFVLSHAGMMLVVMTLMDMVGGFGSPIVLIIGNLFVMGLEGLIVGIQTLRLEYYEMFSRYYVGGGKKFEVMSVD